MNMMNQVPHVQVPQVPQVPAVLISKLQECSLMDCNPRWTLVEWNDGAKLVVKFSRSSKSEEKPKRKRRRRRKPGRPRGPRREAVEKSTNTPDDLAESEVMQTDSAEQSEIRADPASQDEEKGDSQPVEMQAEQSEAEHGSLESDDSVCEDNVSMSSDDNDDSQIIKRQAESEVSSMQESDDSSSEDESSEQSEGDKDDSPPIVQPTSLKVSDESRKSEVDLKEINQRLQEEKQADWIFRPSSETKMKSFPLWIAWRYCDLNTIRTFGNDYRGMKSHCKSVCEELFVHIRFLEKRGNLCRGTRPNKVAYNLIDGVRVHKDYRVLVTGTIRKYENNKDRMSLCADCFANSDTCENDSHNIVVINEYKKSSLYKVLQTLFLFRQKDIYVANHGLEDDLSDVQFMKFKK